MKGSTSTVRGRDKGRNRPEGSSEGAAEEIRVWDERGAQGDPAAGRLRQLTGGVPVEHVPEDREDKDGGRGQAEEERQVTKPSFTHN